MNHETITCQTSEILKIYEIIFMFLSRLYVTAGTVVLRK